MKRLTLILLALALLCCLLPTIVFAADIVDSGSCGENATWRLEDGILTISGTGAMKDYEFGESP